MKLYQATLIIFLGALLIACATTKPSAVVNIQSASYLNPDINGRASPIVVSIYQLKSPYTFKTANYNALANNSSVVLGSDLIDKKIFEIRPNEKKTIPLALAQNTNYIGITAGYRNIDQAHWHEIIRIPAKGKQVQVLVDLESQGLTAHLIPKEGFKLKIPPLKMPKLKMPKL